MKKISALLLTVLLAVSLCIPAAAVPATASEAIRTAEVTIVEEVTEREHITATESVYGNESLLGTSILGNMWDGWDDYAFDTCKPLGAGTKEEPYGIRDAGNLMWLSVNVAKGTGGAAEAYYILQNDINLSPVAGISGDGDWNPIGWYLDQSLPNSFNAFKGTFDGNGYTVSGLYISDASGKRKQYTGLFGILDGACIKNLSIEGAYVKGFDHVGILCGEAAGTTEIRDVTVSGYAGAGAFASESVNIGGIAGTVKGSGTGASAATVLENCRAESFTAYSTGAVSCIGGIAGKAENAYIVDSFVKAGSTSIKGTGYVGGITGEQKDTCIYNAYITGTVGGSGTLSAGGVCGRFVSGEIFLIQMDGSIGSTNQVAAHEGIIAGTRDSSSVLTYGNTKTDNMAYLFFDEDLNGMPLCASGIRGDARSDTQSSHTGFWTSNELKYSLLAGTNEYPCEADRYFYEELEDGVRFIVTEKLNRKFSVSDYDKGLRFSIDHFAPGISGSPVSGHLLSIPQINSKNSSDYDVAYLSAIAGGGSIYYKEMNKESAGAVSPGTLVTVTAGAKNDKEHGKYFQRVVDETVEPEKMVRPTYTVTKNGITEVYGMDYQTGGAYTFIMPDCDTEINILYEKVLSEVITDPLTASFSITEVRSGDRKNPEITWNISDENGHSVCSNVSRKRTEGNPLTEQMLSLTDVTASDVNVIFNSISSDNKVKWSIDDPSLVSILGTDTGYTEGAAKIRPVPDMGNTWLLSLLSRLEKMQAQSGYVLRIPSTEYSKSAVLTAVTDPEHSIDNKAQYAHCTVTVSFKVIDETVLLSESVATDKNEVIFNVVRKLTGSRQSPAESFTVTGTQTVKALLMPPGADIKDVTWELTGDAASSLRTSKSGEYGQELLISQVFDGKDVNLLPAWMKQICEADDAVRKADRNAVLKGSGTRTGLVTVTAVDRELGIHKDSCTVRLNFSTSDETKVNTGGSYQSVTSYGGGGVSGGGTTTTRSTSGSVTGLPSYVAGGNWSLGGNGKWRFASTNGHTYTSEWGAIYNPYAGDGQAEFDWFAFDEDSNMRTGWFTDTDGAVYYLYEKSDGTLGHMVAGYQYIDGYWYYFREKSDGHRGMLLTDGMTPGGQQTDGYGRILIGAGPAADPDSFTATRNTTESLKAAGITG